jgi:hypothetical protein
MSLPHKLVPVEPTEEMLIAAWRCTGESQAMQSRVFDRMRNYFAAMIDASPEATPTPDGWQDIAKQRKALETIRDADDTPMWISAFARKALGDPL